MNPLEMEIAVAALKASDEFRIVRRLNLAFAGIWETKSASTVYRDGGVNAGTLRSDGIFPGCA